jgi:DNA-nicking Smr family endonuclease
MNKVSLKSLRDLKTVSQRLKEQAEREARLAAERDRLEREQQAERELFSRSIGPVRPLQERHRQRQPPANPRPPPVALQQQADERAVMQEALSDEFDVETLLDTDDALSYRREGLGPDVVRKLRRGGWKLQGQIDLHGLRQDQAREALAEFIRQAHKQGLRCVRVVHGKGLGSPGKTPVLKSRVQRWLVQKKEVLAFVQARPADGGGGALVVLLAQAS